MCEFKFCAGAHACFLRNVSPCPKSERSNATVEPMPTPGGRNRGFLDRDQLIAVLGVEESDPQAAEQRMGRIVSKLRLAAANIGVRAAS